MRVTPCKEGMDQIPRSPQTEVTQGVPRLAEMNGASA